MNKKHFFLFMLFLILFALLAGCGRTGENASLNGDMERSGENTMLTPAEFWMAEYGIDVTTCPNTSCSNRAAASWRNPCST